MNEHGHRLAKQLTPAAADSPRTKSRAYALMSETLLDNSGEIFDHGRPVSHCIIHNKLCPVFDTDIGANRCSDAGTPCVYAIATDSEIDVGSEDEDELDQDVSPELVDLDGPPKLADLVRHRHFEAGTSCTDYAGYAGHEEHRWEDESAFGSACRGDAFL